MVPRVAIAGIGGFGGSHHEVFKKLESQGKVRVTATCDPALPRLAEACQLHQFAERGVQTYTSFDDMLAAQDGHLDLGVIAAPPNVHAVMHAALVERGIACYLEKPPTLDLAELHQMLAVEKRATSATNVGFRFIHHASHLQLKERMVRGEFGALRRVSFLGLSPRSPAYFQRSNWAGRLMLQEHLLLDSCLGNAMAHFVNSLLFFADLTQVQAWARPQEMKSELYRANVIEGTDTIFASGKLKNGVDFRIAGTHACSGSTQELMETIVFEDATITIRNISEGSIERPGRASEKFSLHPPTLEDCVSDYLNFYEGHVARPPQTLADSLGFVETNALFYLAAGGHIHHIPSTAIATNSQNGTIAITDIAQVADQFITHSEFPSQNSQCTWGQQGGSSTAEKLAELPQAILALRHEKP